MKDQLILLAAAALLIAILAAFGTFAPEAVPVRGDFARVETRSRDHYRYSGGVMQLEINEAEFSELCELPGIDAARAQAIVEDRTANGAFRSVEELTRVNGIGEKTVRRIEAYVFVR